MNASTSLITITDQDIKRHHEPWNRCDVCGRFISFNDFDCGNAVRKMITPDSHLSHEDYMTLCETHRDS